MQKRVASFASILIALCAAITIFASGGTSKFPQARTKTLLNNDWTFVRSDDPAAKAEDWKPVTLPHTWNADDTLDDEPGYYRAACWYRRELKLDHPLAGKRLFIYFEGANQVAEVHVNGMKAGSHIGGYSAFAFDITGLVKANETNVITVRVDNTFNEDIPPLTADFNFYGGIYRDVWLIETSDLHFGITDSASPGVTITTPDIANGTGTVKIEGKVVNDSGRPRNLDVVTSIFDASGKQVANSVSSAKALTNVQSSFNTRQAVKSPRPWSTDDPYLYSVRISIREGGKVIDEITQPLGFRWYKFDADKGFFLNGKHLNLRGVNRHQDFLGLGNALPNDYHVRDMQIIKDMGFNFVRLAHYPQDPAVLDACDRLGLVVWEETPLVNYITKSEAFTENSKSMVREMVRQHRNHPSIVLWGYMNEIYLRVPKGRDDLYPATVELAKKLNALAKTEDPTRTTTIALHGSELYNKYGLADVPDVVGWNLYLGWYGGEIDQFGRFLDDQHKRYSTRPLIVSEYGANADRRFHSTEPRRFDSTSEYSRKFHESYLAQLDARVYISGSTLWNNFDFGAENRGETIPHVNQKGMLTFDRKPKDVYYFYKAALSKAQVTHVAVGDQPIFAGDPDREFPIDVYSNSGEVDLELNGKSLGRKPTDGTHKATWNVHFKRGKNTLSARGTSTSDKAEVTFIAVTASSPEIAINVGSNADYTDASGRVWLADRPFKNGTWGFVGAAATRVYGTPGDPNIRETIDDGLFQTMCEGLESYKIDVPAGNYQVELMFAETKNEKAGKRIFDVSINSKPVIAGLDLAASPGAYKPWVKTFDVTTSGGIDISFSSKTGKAILNALRIVRK